ncbi:hypothetical protein [Dactylosporangium sp. NPDC051541]|uniref:hypothetical protein n=1 Tax=Dactylosporangium sp. NPDC051541 TaxID=3363977 RepID=UPI0037BAC97E
MAAGQRLNRQADPVDLEHVDGQIVQLEVQRFETIARLPGISVETHGVTPSRTLDGIPTDAVLAAAFHFVPSGVILFWNGTERIDAWTPRSGVVDDS